MQEEPATAAFNDLSGDPILLPAEHSWMVPAANVAETAGSALRRQLQLGGSRPPFIMFIFPKALLCAAGVMIREPRGFDALPGRNLQWTPGGVPDERVDNDIPLLALGWIEWRP
ncbi:hypothetical protein [Candidatus Poriferisodalis sp.]|uniref:hypothetical protein n=1 Tax=Candidatus Poriferisodalis sp. TaxID=3101277 RepID=UPI003B011C79